MPTEPEKLDSIEKRMDELRLLIKEAGSQTDLDKAKTAAALGAGVFTLMLALGAAYDLVTGNPSLQIALGVSKDVLMVITVALGVSSLVWFVIGVRRSRRRYGEQAAKLDELEEEFAQLLDRKKSLTESAE